VTTTVIAALKPLPPQGLFGPAVRLALAEAHEVHVDQAIAFDRGGFPMRVTYATHPGQGLLANVVEVNCGAQVLPPEDFLALPSVVVPAYALLTLDTPHRHVPATPRVIDLHAWLLARITDLLMTNGVPWLWTSTGPWSVYSAWRDDLFPTSPLGDAFAWQASLEDVV
jgi:hypothetical protein